MTVVLPVVELVSVVVGGHDVQEEDVLGLLVQPRELELHLGKHLPAKKILWIKRFSNNFTRFNHFPRSDIAKEGETP